MDNDSADLASSLVDRSVSVGRQPGKPSWLATVVNLTQPAALPDGWCQQNGEVGGQVSRRRSACFFLFVCRTSSTNWKTKRLKETRIDGPECFLV